MGWSSCCPSMQYQPYVRDVKPVPQCHGRQPALYDALHGPAPRDCFSKRECLLTLAASIAQGCKCWTSAPCEMFCHVIVSVLSGMLPPHHDVNRCIVDIFITSCNRWKGLIATRWWSLSIQMACSCSHRHTSTEPLTSALGSLKNS